LYGLLVNIKKKNKNKLANDGFEPGSRAGGAGPALLNHVHLPFIYTPCSITLTLNLFELNGHSDVDTRTDSVLWVTDPDSTGLMHLSCMRNGVNPGLLRAIRCIRSIPEQLVVCGYESSEMGVPLSNQVVFYYYYC